MEVELSSRRILIRGISTHIVAEAVMKDLRDLLVKKDRVINTYLEGGPGPLGRGMVIEIIVSDELSQLEMRAIKRFFKLRDATIIER